MTDIFSFTGALFYVGATVALLRQSAAVNGGAAPRGFDLLLAYPGAIAHGLSLAPVVLSTGGVNLALGTTLSLIGFVIVILFLLARLLQPIRVVLGP